MAGRAIAGHGAAPGGQDRTGHLGGGTGPGGALRSGGELTRPPASPVFFLLHFYKGKGACQLSSPTLRESLCCVVLFCKVYNF